MLYGTSIASFTIEGFGLEKLINLSLKEVDCRVKNIKSKIDLRKK